MSKILNFLKVLAVISEIKMLENLGKSELKINHLKITISLIFNLIQ
jgi:hypothetical protein